MKNKTRADIALEIKALRQQEREIVNKTNLALGEEVARAIKAGKLDGDQIYETLAVHSKSKKNRALLSLDSFVPDQDKPPALPETKTDESPALPEATPTTSVMDKFKSG